jgi:NAD(P)-dependent dehydrogenase (short-subunit alcohol dehydrogenase family)
MVEAAARALGRIDVLVNNAGVYEAHPITETTYEDWQQGFTRRSRSIWSARQTSPGARSATWGTAAGSSTSRRVERSAASLSTPPMAPARLA